jgi:hypothetical protein
MPTHQVTRTKKQGRMNVIYRDAKGRTKAAAVLLASPRPAPPTGLVCTPGAAGTLNNGTYGFRVSAVVGGVEGLACVTATATTVAGPGAGSVGLAWNAVANATSYKVYGRTSGGELLMGTVTAPTVVFVDNNSVSPSGALPTLANATATVNIRASKIVPKSGFTGVPQAVAMRGAGARYFYRFSNPAGYSPSQRS